LTNEIVFNKDAVLCFKKVNQKKMVIKYQILIRLIKFAPLSD
jgi:hypothetical protein